MSRSWFAPTTCLIVAAGFGLLHPTAAVAQVSATLTAANVTPVWSAWPSTPGQLSLVLNSTLPDPPPVTVRGVFSLNGAQVGTAPSSIAVLPTGVSVYNGTQIAQWAAATFSPGVQAEINATGRLPAGSWQLCVEIADPDGILFQAGGCANFTVQAGTITAMLAAVNVSPFPGQWSTLPAQFALITQSTMGAAAPVTASGRLRRDGAQVGTVPSGLTSIPNGSGNFTGTQIAQWGALLLTGPTAAAVEATGRLPAGSYEFCLDLADASDTRGPSSAFPAVSACAPFTLQSATVVLALAGANVPAYPADWATLPATFTLMTTSNFGAPLPAVFAGRLRQNGAQVGTVPSDLSSIPNGSGTFTSSQIARWGDLVLTGVTGQTVAATGRLPAGSYEFCLDATSTSPAPAFPPLSACAPFVVQPATITASLAAGAVSRVVAEWATRPAQFTLVTTSTVGRPAEVQLTGRLRKDGALVGTVPGALAELPAGPGTFTSVQAFRWGDLSLTGAVAASVAATGRLPVGSYDLCADMTSPTTIPAFPPVTSCATFVLSFTGTVTATLTAPNPSPVLASWRTVPSALALVVTNTTGEVVHVTSSVRLRQGGVEVGVAPGTIAQIPAQAATSFPAPQIGRWEEWTLAPQVGGVVSRTGRLPDGGYEVCATFDELLVAGSALPAVQSCTMLMFGTPSAARLVLPLDGAGVPQRFPVFQWTPAVSIGVPQVRYRVTVVEVIEGQHPVQAVTANRPVLDTTVTAATTLPYPPTGFPLVAGQQYAWRVQALAPAAGPGGIPVPVGTNEGRSEVFTFRHTTLVAQRTDTIPPSGPGGVLPPGATEAKQFWNASLSGRIQYSFLKSDVPAPRRVSLPTVGGLPTPGQMGSGATGQGGPPPPLPLFQFTGAPERRDLAGVTVRLVVRYRASSQAILGGPVTVGGKTYNDVGKVVASAITGPDGSFAFFFHDDHPTGLLNLIGAPVSWGAGDLVTTIPLGLVARFYNVEVGDPRYLTPSDELTLNADRTGNAGTLVSLVRSWQLVVHMRRVGSQDAPPPLEVQVLRGHRPALVPPNEGTAPLPRKQWTHPHGGPVEPREVIAETTSSLGQHTVTFSRLVRNVGPTDKYHVRVFSKPGDLFSYKEQIISVAQGWMFQMGSPKPWDAAYYNEQYAVLVDTLKMVMFPNAPRYAGTAVDIATQQPVTAGVAALLANGTLERLRNFGPGDQGRFVFDSLKSDVSYLVRVHAKGYLDDAFAIPAITPGQQIVREHQLSPNAIVRGRVVDEHGTPTYAPAVWVDNGPGKPTTPFWRGTPQPAGGLTAGRVEVEAWVFEVPASSGTRTITVDAGPKYFLETRTGVTVPAGTTNVGEFTVYRRLHRLRLRVLQQGAGSAFQCNGTPISGARVSVAVAGGPSGTTDGQGWVQLAWEAPTNATTIRVQGPAGQDWVYQERQFTIPESRQPVERCTRMDRGGQVTGIVYAGTTDSVPVSGARVFVDGSGPLYAKLQDSTDAQGRFRIHGVPAGTHVVRGAKSQSQFVGDSVSVTVAAGQTVTRNLHLRFYEGMDIASLLGFALEVHSLTDLPSGARISGALVPPASGGTWVLDNPAKVLAFDSVTIVPAGGGSTAAVPAAGAVLLGDPALALRGFGNPDLWLRQANAQAGLLVRDRGDGMGAVQGPVELQLESFAAVTGAELGFTDLQHQPVSPHLLQPGATGSARTSLFTLSGDGSAPAAAAGLDVGRADGSGLPFRLFQFRADADPSTSKLRADGLHLAATLHTSIPGVGDLGIQLPDLHVVPGAGAGKGLAYPIQGAQAINGTLQQWTLVADSWLVGQGTVKLVQGEVRVPIVPDQPASTTAFPFTGMTVTPTSLSGGDFGTGPITLAGAVPLAMLDGVLFGRQGNSGPWRLSAPAAVIPALPGMRPTDQVLLNSVTFTSDGERLLSMASGTLVQLYETADLTITGMSFDQNRVSFIGALDLDVPGLSQTAAELGYTRQGNDLIPALGPLAWDPIEIDGAKLRITSGSLSAAGFSGDAQVFVPGKFNVASRFERTPRTGTNEASAVPIPTATFSVGEFALGKLEGGARLASGGWSTGWTGEVQAGQEMNGTISVAVKGAAITAGAGGFAVKGVATPFGDVTIHVNFDEQRYEGYLAFDGNISKSLHADGNAEFQFSGRPGNRYWYVFTGATFTLESPKLSAVAAMVVGNVAMQAPLLAKFNQYSTKPIPASFQTIAGFFLDGKISIPLPICPSGSFDIGVAKVGVWCNAWGGMRLGMNWADEATLFIGTLVGAGVGVEASFGLGLCISVWGSVTAELEAVGQVRADGAWYVWGGAEIGLNAGASYGVGIDDLCLEKSKSYTIDLGAESQVGHNWNTNTGPYFKVYYK